MPILEVRRNFDEGDKNSHMPLSTSFESARLYGAREAFATARGFLLDERPRVLALSSMQAPEVPGLVSIGPPEALPLRPNQPDQKRSPEPARAFNPSIALAPHGLCPRCKYAMTLRVDTLHQCDSESSPYNGGPARLANGNWFQGTVVGILDAELRLLGWTWLLNAPAYQIASADQNASTSRRAGCLLAGHLVGLGRNRACRAVVGHLFVLGGGHRI